MSERCTIKNQNKMSEKWIDLGVYIDNYNDSDTNILINDSIKKINDTVTKYKISNNNLSR